MKFAACRRNSSVFCDILPQLVCTRRSRIDIGSKFIPTSNENRRTSFGLLCNLEVDAFAPCRYGQQMAMGPSLEQGVSARAFLEDLDGPLTFGELLESIRESEEMSRKEFAYTLGISPQRLCDYEKGRVFPSPQTAWGYAQSLGYSGAQFAALAVEGSMAASGHFVRVQMIPLK